MNGGDIMEEENDKNIISYFVSVSKIGKSCPPVIIDLLYSIKLCLTDSSGANYFNDEYFACEGSQQKISWSKESRYKLEEKIEFYRLNTPKYRSSCVMKLIILLEKYYNKNM